MNKTQLRALQSTWREKLKESGFDDTEDRKGNLKSFHSYMFRRARRDKGGGLDSHIRYYELARHLLHSHPFLSKEAFLMWSLHSEGATTQEISDKTGRSYKVVDRFIKKTAGHIKLKE